MAEINGKHDVCFKDTTRSIISNEWYQERIDDSEDDLKWIVLTPTNMILNEVQGGKYHLEIYPTNEDISNVDKNREWLPMYLRILLE